MTRSRAQLVIPLLAVNVIVYLLTYEAFLKNTPSLVEPPPHADVSNLPSSLSLIPRETSTTSTIQCITGKPCNNYTDDVDFRIIVITYNRAGSLMKLLRSLDNIELDGDKASLEIWIDVNEKRQVHTRTEKTAKSFNWTKGPTRVHVQPSHVGIMGQWIDTWRPRPESREIGLILEDDISVSVMAYRWLKAVHKEMANRTDFVGASLTSDDMRILSLDPKGPLAAPKNETILMYKCLGTWGFSPKPEHWRRFQDWFHLHKPSVAPRFHPYVPDAQPSEWYKVFENTGRAETMWEMWFIHYMHIEQVFCVYNNLGVYTGNKESCLCINRREIGLHFHKKGREDYCTLLNTWKDEFVRFPEDVVRLHWDGMPMDDRDFFL